MNPNRSLRGRVLLSRTDLRDALMGLLGGVIVAAAAGLGMTLASMVKPYEARNPSGGAPETFASYVGGLSLVGAAVWSETWVPSEWRAWARPADDLAWPPPAEMTWECPPGAICCYELPETICRPDRWQWRSSTPPCPFEPAPLAELPWAMSSYRGDTLDSTGQPIWLGCEVHEGTWHIVEIRVGLDGDALTEDDRVRECLGPQLGWPSEYIGGWPVGVKP
ncbi:MAG: hypothetical protein EOO74_05985 [Myxococcales bacterium]|nr:MAG: hypothetical protein EOO74_05985 [Myxococcales bacterium]